MKINNSKKAVIHIAKSQTGMSEDEYRGLLSSVGVKSSRDLTYKKFKAVMDEFKKLGFITTSKIKTKKQRIKVPESKELLTGKIKAILGDLNLSLSYADGMAKKMFKIDFFEWADPDQLRRLVAALMYHKKRIQGVKGSRG
ncbi:MAG: regulatory protein GemA [Deltaproteobacteria bacterium]|nr:regulatory protein GemA [Deltaproteobacteria bacterium]